MNYLVPTLVWAMFGLEQCELGANDQEGITLNAKLCNLPKSVDPRAAL